MKLHIVIAAFLLIAIGSCTTLNQLKESTKLTVVSHANGSTEYLFEIDSLYPTNKAPKQILEINTCMNWLPFAKLYGNTTVDSTVSKEHVYNYISKYIAKNGYKILKFNGTKPAKQ